MTAWIQLNDYQIEDRLSALLFVFGIVTELLCEGVGIGWRGVWGWQLRCHMENAQAESVSLGVMIAALGHSRRTVIFPSFVSQCIEVHVRISTQNHFRAVRVALTSSRATKVRGISVYCVTSYIQISLFGGALTDTLPSTPLPHLHRIR